MWCYIIYSESIDRFYIGVSSDPKSRLIKHNNHEYGANHYTSQSNDWELFHTIKCNSSSQALKLESHIKRMKSRKYLINLKTYPEIESKLLIKYSN